MCRVVVPAVASPCGRASADTRRFVVRSPRSLRTADERICRAFPRLTRERSQPRTQPCPSSSGKVPWVRAPTCGAATTPSLARSSPMQERRPGRSRAGGRLLLVPTQSSHQRTGTPACPRQRQRRSCPRIVLLGRARGRPGRDPVRRPSRVSAISRLGMWRLASAVSLVRPAAIASGGTVASRRGWLVGVRCGAGGVPAVMPGLPATSRPSPGSGRGADPTSPGRSALWRAGGCRS
jgi:hypothetical protein